MSLGSGIYDSLRSAKFCQEVMRLIFIALYEIIAELAELTEFQVQVSGGLERGFLISRIVGGHGVNGCSERSFRI